MLVNGVQFYIHYFFIKCRNRKLNAGISSFNMLLKTNLIAWSKGKIKKEFGCTFFQIHYK
jgi:hypothetical protein